MVQVKLEEAQAQLQALVEAARQGEEVFILLEDGNVLHLELKRPGSRRFGSAKGLITMSDDFDAPLEDFEPYMR